MVNIRVYQDRDFPELESVLKATKLHDHNFDQRERYKAKIGHDAESILVAEEDNRIVGGVILIYDPFASSIWHLCVDPAYQNKGIGSLLLERALEVLEARGSNMMIGYINSRDEELARFYERRGITVCRELPIFGIEKRLNPSTTSPIHP